MKELHTTLDGKHWNLEDSSRAARRSQPPAGAHERAPSKSGVPRSPPPVSPRVLFQSGAPSASSPSDVGASSPKDLPPADLDSGDDGNSTVVLLHTNADEEDHRSFVDDFLPPGITGSGLLSGSGTILNTTASAVRGATVAAVRQMFSSEHRSQRSTDTRARPDAPAMHEQTASQDRAPREQGPSFEQFAVMQRKYAALKKQMDDLLSKHSAEQRVRDIEAEVEKHRKEAYEKAGMLYTPRANSTNAPAPPALLAPPGPPAAQLFGPRPTEYRISHKSIGYLRPADGSYRPFEAVDGEVYVRPLAWLAHLRTKLELKEDDFNYKNQVLQVASECLVGRAAAWWTAIGQRMRNMLLAD